MLLLMWFFHYWKYILLAVGIAVLVWLLSGCTFIIDTGPISTLESTVTLPPVEATEDPTPTQEVGTLMPDCIPNSYARIGAGTALYEDAGLKEERSQVKRGEYVKFVTRDTATGHWWVVTTDGEMRDGFVDPDDIPVDCQ